MQVRPSSATTRPHGPCMLTGGGGGNGDSTVFGVCGGGGMDRGGKESIWDLIQSFNMYDPMALLASIPQIRHRYFEWESKVVNGVEHIVIGVSKEKHGVKEELAAELISFMYNSFLKGVTLDWSEFDLVNKAVKTTDDSSGASSVVSSQENTPRSNQLSPRRIIDVTDGASLPNTLTRVRGEKAAINFDNELFMSQFDEHLQEVLRVSSGSFGPRIVALRFSLLSPM